MDLNGAWVIFLLLFSSFWRKKNHFDFLLYLNDFDFHKKHALYWILEIVFLSCWILQYWICVWRPEVNKALLSSWDHTFGLLRVIFSQWDIFIYYTDIKSFFFFFRLFIPPWEFFLSLRVVWEIFCKGDLEENRVRKKIREGVSVGSTKKPRKTLTVKSEKTFFKKVQELVSNGVPRTELRRGSKKVSNKFLTSIKIQKKFRNIQKNYWVPWRLRKFSG